MPVPLSPLARYIVVTPAIVTEAISPRELAVAVCRRVFVKTAVRERCGRAIDAAFGPGCGSQTQSAMC